MSVRQPFHRFRQNSLDNSPLDPPGRVSIRKISSKIADGYRTRRARKNRKRVFSHLALFPKVEQETLENKMIDLRFQNSADLNEPSCYHFEINNQDSHSKVGSEISSLRSFEQGDTPASKTKKFHDGLHVWLNKIHYYQKQKLFHIFGGYHREQKQEANKNTDLHANSIENLPEEALSCYNEYRTQNFNTFFEALRNANSKNGLFEALDDLNAPVISPINQLTFENLQKLKNDVFRVEAEFSDDSSVSLVDDSRTGEDLLSEEKIRKVSTPVDADALSSDKTLLESPNDSIQKSLTESTQNSSNDSIRSLTPDTIKDLFQNTAEDLDEDQGEGKGLEVKQEFEIEHDLNIGNEGYFSVSSQTNGSDSISRKRSIIERVRSAFKGTSSSNNTSRSASTTSSYSPVSIIIPALKKSHNFIFDISGEISEGNPIDSVYFPEDDNGSSASTDENTPIDLKNLDFFDPKPHDESTPESKKMTSLDTAIKFDKFAQIILYDGSKRLKNQVKSMSKSVITKNKYRKAHDRYKNNGSLILTSANPIGKTKGFKKANSTAAALNSLDGQLKIREALNSANTRIRPILKSRHNENAHTESMRAKYCDDVEIEEFISFFQDHERKRLETEPFLEGVREKQINTYYSSESFGDDMSDRESSLRE